jgi:hypothetical protein
MSASSSVGQRFSQLIQALGMSKNAFAISLDKTATVIQHLVDERNKPGFDLMNKVVDVYPNVSIEWLLRGKGPMLLNAIPAAADVPAAAAPAAPSTASPATTAPKAAPATPTFPTPLFAISAARPAAAVALVSPVETPLATAAAAPEVADSTEVLAAAEQPAPAPAAASVQPELAPAAPATQLPPPAPAALDAATLTAALHAQHLQHQLALAEQRNQHLLEQQKLILERQALMQQMLDLMRRPV